MMSRLAETFARLRSTRRPGLITYVTAGDPDVGTSERILVALARAGADVIEVGVPFSDPLADGPVIQRASERALAAVTFAALTRAADPDVVDTPVVLFTHASGRARSRRRSLGPRDGGVMVR
jgi:tryptophan synthase alpha chain